MIAGTIEGHRLVFNRLLLGVVVGGAVVAGLGGCTTPGTSPGTRPAERPNILLLSVDTLRFDHIGANGYSVTPSVTPWIDSLAAGGVTFAQTASSAPETAPGVATLVTGLYQDRHGVMYNRAELTQENQTLAERMRIAGYQTAAFIGNANVDGGHGFGQGFDRVEVISPGPDTFPSTDDKLASAFGGYLRDREAKGNWFAWVHLMDPHGPYNSASAWWSADLQYASPSTVPERVLPVSESNFGLGVIPLYQKLPGTTGLADYVQRYDGELRFTDSQIGVVLAMLSKAGQLENTVVVLVADHGESLVEHDEFFQHGWFVYDTTVRIPFLISWPGRTLAGARVDAAACGVDVVPTILDLAGVEASAEEFDGKSLACALSEGDRCGLATASVRGSVPSLREKGCFSIGPRANHPFSLRGSQYKMIVTPVGAPRDPRAPKGQRTNDPERVELYDHVSDPGETQDLASKRPDLVGAMEQDIARMRARVRSHGWRW